MSLGITRESLYNGYGDVLEARRLALKPRPSAYDLEKMRWDGVTGFNIFHPDDINSTVPIACMKTNPNIMTLLPTVCTPNQAWKDEQERLGIKLTLPTDIFTKKPVVEIVDTNGETIPITQKQENLAPLVMLAGLAALLFMGG